MKLSRRDYTITALLIILIALLIYLIDCHCRSKHANRASTKPVGTVEYKYHDVQRKASDRLAWEPVKPKTELYRYDSVMTKDKSDARIHLNNGLKVEVDPNTMLEIDFIDEQESIALKEGGVKVDSKNAKGATITTSDGTRINLDKAKAQINASSEGVSVDVKEGNVNLAKDGKSTQLTAGEQIRQSKSGEIKKQKSTIRLIAPLDGAILNTSKNGIQFQWELEEKNEACSLNMTSNSKTTRTHAVQGTSISLKLADGSFSWQIKCKNAVSATHQFRLRPQGYREETLAVTQQPDLKKPDQETTASTQINSTEPSISSPKLSEDQKNLTVRNDKPKTKPSTTPNNLRDVAREITISGDANKRIFIEPDARSGNVRLAWRLSPPGKKMTYTVKVSKDSEFSDSALSREVGANNSARLKLTPGKYFYRIDVFDSNRNEKLASSPTGSIEIVRKKLPDPPEVKSVTAD